MSSIFIESKPWAARKLVAPLLLACVGVTWWLSSVLYETQIKNKDSTIAYQEELLSAYRSLAEEKEPSEAAIEIAQLKKQMRDLESLKKPRLLTEQQKGDLIAILRPAAKISPHIEIFGSIDPEATDYANQWLEILHKAGWKVEVGRGLVEVGRGLTAEEGVTFQADDLTMSGVSLLSDAFMMVDIRPKGILNLEVPAGRLRIFIGPREI